MEFIGGTPSVASTRDMTEDVPPSIFPNPFNPTTTIRFDLPAASWVRLEVFDIAGRIVGARSPRPYMEGWRHRGTHEVTFDGTGLPSGIYIYRLSAGEFTASGKMLLLK